MLSLKCGVTFPDVVNSRLSAEKIACVVNYVLQLILLQPEWQYGINWSCTSENEKTIF